MVLWGIPRLGFESRRVHNSAFIIRTFRLPSARAWLLLLAFAGQLRSTTFQNLETRKGEKIGQTEVWREAAQIDPERPFLWPSVSRHRTKRSHIGANRPAAHPVTFRLGIEAVPARVSKTRAGVDVL